ncbi:helix-hairpin-helix domain-containing protein [Dyella humicola]|uniref:helix-hairpin-helix domain-containing protein n=1 Tax=Dyella humicola TaxID=2992126 RepID=UPI00224EBB21|nr:helix-hairpin-helix domain-containing protein [Dyella humicola]
MDGFSTEEQGQLLALKGIGATVVTRLEQIGFTELAQLAGQDPADLTYQISRALGSTCWHNSPQARAAIQAIVDLARRQSGLAKG